MPKKIDFLQEYVISLLEQNDLGGLSEEQKAIYIPQILELVEERIGLKLMPRLDRKELSKFTELVEKEETTPEEWKEFWYEAIPDFEKEVERILIQIADEAKEILAK